MNIRAYTLNEHLNFAPHISGGLLTLANCMPAIRQHAAVGEWVAGVTPTRMGLRLAYAMCIDDSLTRADYWEKFRKTRLDSIYEPHADAGFRQLDNPWHGPSRKCYDLDVDRILLSSAYYCFSDTYDAWDKLPHGLELPDPYRGLLNKGMRGAGWFRQVPESFLPWLQSQETLVTLATIDEFERILP